MVSFGLCELLTMTNPSAPHAYDATASNTPASPARPSSCEVSFPIGSVARCSVRLVMLVSISSSRPARRGFHIPVTTSLHRPAERSLRPR